ncbi:hypothetical protein ABT390_36800 [Streptomyces aurantiacus]|uniref:Uncharacterized protein n=1 Tax=Streptomyces aurantiacus JA 4570 TaxID=1286094 RepID=S3ZCM5_9ACTN|nr:hypothetical protein [Streptomyces aurantiacus]EPH40893.1 hypothetical protein STRAU_6108 [Streptomyces aurantiacus JA 4570]
MSVQPIQLPYAAGRQTDEQRLTAVETAIASNNLPQLRTVVRDDAVHVIVGDIEQYATWVYALGGESNRAPELDGASLWTLRTETPSGRNRSKVAVRVHVAVVCDESVPVEFRRPVSA